MGGLSPILTSVLMLLAGFSPPVKAQQSGRGRTLTSWDCCKPACAWGSIAREGKATGQVKVCNKQNNPLAAAQGQSEQSSCDKDRPGQGFLCSDYQPKPVTEDLSYAFAITSGNDNCCKCFSLQWTDGNGRGKQVQVQAVNTGGKLEGGVREFVILTPGGGVGPNTGGCTSQYGSDWGRQYGGVVRSSDCGTLPDHLQGGCYWRFNWARGDINEWNVTYNSIPCPEYHTKISGCTPPR